MTQASEQQSIWLKLFHKYNIVPPGFVGPHARLFSAIRFAGPLGIITHFLFFAVFWVLDIKPLVYFNIFSIFIFTFGVWQAARGNLVWFFVGCVLIEVPLHATLATYYIGFETGFWLHVTITISLIILYPAISRQKRFFLSFFYVAVLSAAMVYAVGNDPVADIPLTLVMICLVMNFCVLTTVVMVILASYDVAMEHAEKALQLEFDRAEGLLLNVLPADIAVRLKANEEPLADAHDSASVLFADIAGFTELSRTLSANDLIALLNDLFTRFDALADRYSAEKIKTIGDAYMVSTGLRGEADHAERLADMAIGMQEAFEAFRTERRLDLGLRIGIHSGELVAGVIGKQKFAYDLWGDTVNLASRMESEGVADHIQVSAETLDLLPARFETTSRGEIAIKGHDTRECFLLNIKGT